MTLGLLALLSAGLLVGVPFLVARRLGLVRVAFTVRIGLVVSIPVLLLWWLATDPGFKDIADPGGAAIPSMIMLGWLLGSAWPYLTKTARCACAEAPSDQLLRTERFRIDRWR
jgi:hypothetical protein